MRPSMLSRLSDARLDPVTEDIAFELGEDGTIRGVTPT